MLDKCIYEEFSHIIIQYIKRIKPRVYCHIQIYGFSHISFCVVETVRCEAAKRRSGEAAKRRSDKHILINYERSILSFHTFIKHLLISTNEFYSRLIIFLKRTLCTKSNRSSNNWYGLYQ
jgi:hypothetical protein